MDSYCLRVVFLKEEKKYFGNKYLYIKLDDHLVNKISRCALDPFCELQESNFSLPFSLLKVNRI